MLQRYIDTWTTNKYHICTESESAAFRNESQFQQIYSNIENSQLSPKVLCVIEGRFGKDNSISVNGRYYGQHWKKQLEKEQTQFLLRKGLMYMMFGHVDRGIEDKDVEKGLVAGIVTHLEVIDYPRTIHGVEYEQGDLFGRAIIIDMEAGRNTHTLLSVGSEISISSRGLGEYVEGECHTCEDGRQIPIMNADTYELETFDFTRLPGIPIAEVHCVKDNVNPEPDNIKIEETEFEDDFAFESLEVSEDTKELINESLDSLIFNINKKETDMAKVNGIKVQQVLEDANAKIASLTAKLEAAEEERDAAIAKADELEKKLDDQAEETPDKTESVEAGTEPEEPVEDPAPVKAEVVGDAEPPVSQVDTTELEQFKAIADSPEELEATLVKVEETLRKCEDDAEELEKANAEKAELANKLDEKEADIQEACKVLEAYTKLGSIQKLTAIVESAKRMSIKTRKMETESRRQKLAQFAQYYSNKKGITQESVKRIIESAKSIKDAKRILEGLPNVNVDKDLFKGESTKEKHITPGFATFAESMINKMENRRVRKITTD